MYLPIPGADECANLVGIKAAVSRYLAQLRERGYVVTVTQAPLLPLAMGNYRAEVDVRAVWPPAPTGEACAHCNRLPGADDTCKVCDGTGLAPSQQTAIYQVAVDTNGGIWKDVTAAEYNECAHRNKRIIGTLPAATAASASAYLVLNAKFRQALAPYHYDNDDAAIAKIAELVKMDLAAREPGRAAYEEWARAQKTPQMPWPELPPVAKKMWSVPREAGK